MEKVKRQAQANCYSLFGKDGIMQPVMKIVGSLPRGMKVIYSYYAGNTATYGALGNGQIVLMSSIVDDCFDDEFFGFSSYMNDADAQPIEQQFGIGIYYCENEEPFTEEELNTAIVNAGIREENRKRNEEEKQKASDRRTEQLKKEYDYLTIKTRETTTRDETNNVRKVLKKRFPNVKFSVRYSSFSGGDSIDVSWTDGPMEEDVLPLVRMFQDHHSDYSGDYYDYDPSEFNRLFGGFKFAHGQREFSEEALNEYTDKIIAMIPEFAERRTYNEAHETHPTREQLSDLLSKVWNADLPENTKRYANDYCDYRINARDLAHNWLHSVDLTKKVETIQAKEKTAQTTAKLQIVDYSEKAIAVIGETKDVKDELKELGGRFNPRLSCGAGWIFSKKKENEIREYFNL